MDGNARPSIQMNHEQRCEIRSTLPWRRVNLTLGRRTDCLTGSAKVIDGTLSSWPISSSGCTASTRQRSTRRFSGGVSVRHDVVGRPLGTHSRGQGELRAVERDQPDGQGVLTPRVDIGRTLVSGWAYRRYSKY
jgi:hypothetical protein